MSPGSSNRVLTNLLLFSVSCPITTTAFGMLLMTRGKYVPTLLLLAMTVAAALPFLPLWLLARSDFSDVVRGAARRSDVIVRLAAAWVPMLVLATSAVFAVEWSTFQNLSGSSTTPVAVVMVPIIMTITGFLSYSIAWAVVALASRLRRPHEREYD
jgi:hypothetical protein